jgi:hypothetical protein
LRAQPSPLAEETVHIKMVNLEVAFHGLTFQLKLPQRATEFRRYQAFVKCTVTRK